MKRILLALALLNILPFGKAWSGCSSCFAQSTARKFMLVNSADGESQLTVYLPSAEASAKANGRAVVDCPGGGYTHLAMDHEGHEWAEYYNAQGIAYAVLKYRMPKGNRDIPLSDVYNAIRTVRDSANVWNINPNNVGIMGFSAGGHLASAVATHAPFNLRPDFCILFYPVISMNEGISHKGTCVGFLGDKRNDPALQKEWSSDKAVVRHLVPPTILILANDDRIVPPATNAAAFYTEMRKAGNNCSMFCYPTGGHGFGFRTSFKYHDLMLAELTQWLSDLQLPTASAQKIACVGNSITDGHGIDMQELFDYPAVLGQNMGNGYYVKNFGISSRVMSNSGDFPYQKEPAWKACLEWKPNIVIIKLGTNDTKSHNWKTAENDFVPSMKQMVDSLRALPTNPRIIFLSPIKAIKQSWDIRDSVIVNGVMPRIQAFAKKEGLEYYDMHAAMDLPNLQTELLLDDGIHPNAKGAAKMADLLSEYLKNTPDPRTLAKDRKKNKKRKK